MELELGHITPYLEHKVNVRYKGIINGKELGVWHREQGDASFFEPETRPIPDEIIGDKTGLIKKVEIYLKYWKLLVGNGHKAIYPSDFGKTAFLVLHSLSDLTKEIEVNGEKFVPNDKLYELGLPTYEVGFGWSYKGMAFIVKKSIDSYNKMIEWHFDVEHFNGVGLIESGLAIDTNTL